MPIGLWSLLRDFIWPFVLVKAPKKAIYLGYTEMFIDSKIVEEMFLRGVNSENGCDQRRRLGRGGQKLFVFMFLDSKSSLITVNIRIIEKWTSDSCSAPFETPICRKSEKSER